MSFFAYNHVYIQILEDAMEEFIVLYYTSAAAYNQFITLVELSPLLDKKFLVGAPNKLYVETVAHIYWIIRIIADPDKDTMEMRQYIRMFNPFFEIEELFTKAIGDYKLQAEQHMEQIERDEVQQFPIANRIAIYEVPRSHEYARSRLQNFLGYALHGHEAAPCDVARILWLECTKNLMAYDRA